MHCKKFALRGGGRFNHMKARRPETDCEIQVIFFSANRTF
jgi:hypothetical protein